MLKKDSLYIENISLVLKDEIVHKGSILIKHGIIEAINPVSVSDALTTRINLSGQCLLPGMIDLHCDSIEKEVEPRPLVHFPFDFACSQADKKNAASGITTVFHALSFANDELGVRNNEIAAAVIEAVHSWQPFALVDNRIHCRYEITDPDGLQALTRLIDDNRIDLLSVMDHTPGQGQFKEISSYRDYLVKVYKKDKEEADQLIREKFKAAESASKRLEQIIEYANRVSIPVASHDDDSTERVKFMHGLGVRISEFPINLDTASEANQNGMFTVAGSPNILRGGSQSGSMSALDGIKAGAINCLCSDYSPATLLVAVFQLSEKYEMPLHEAVRLATYNPAMAAGLDDRGEIAVGKRADLISVASSGRIPHVTNVFVKGRNVLSARFNYE